MARKTKQMADRAVSHWRLAAGLAAGVIAWTTAKYFGAPKASHLLLGWDVAAVVYLLTTWSLFLRADEAEVRERAANEDEGVPVLLLIILAAIVASLGAVVDAMIAAKHSGDATKVFI